MTDSDKIEFARQMAVLSTVFNNGTKLSKALLEIYFRVLSRIDIADLVKAVAVLVDSRTLSSLPKPAEIIQAIEGTQEDKALVAWAMVDKSVKSVGKYQSVQFADPVIHSVIQFWGGWVKLCETDADEWKWKAKEFMTLYRSLARRGDHPEKLLGIAEYANFGVYDTDEPVLIGFDRKLLN